MISTPFFKLTELFDSEGYASTLIFTQAKEVWGWVLLVLFSAPALAGLILVYTFGIHIPTLIQGIVTHLLYFRRRSGKPARYHA